MNNAYNRWSISEYMRQRFMRTGQVPDEDELRAEFEGIDQTELHEGIVEFDAIAGEWPELEVQRAKAD